MTFGNNNGAKGNAVLSNALQNAPQDARRLDFMEGPVRQIQQQFNLPSPNGPFESAVVFFQAMRLQERISLETRAADAFDALFYVMAGSVTESHLADYRRLLEAYWSNRSSLASSFDRPFQTIAQRERTTRSVGSANLTLGAGCFVAEVGNSRFIASIAQSLRVAFRNCVASAI